MLVEQLLKVVKAKKVYCDGKIYKPKRDNRKAINSAECVANHLHIYTKWGTNRYAVVVVMQLNAGKTKKKKEFYYDYITSDINDAICQAQYRYAQRHKVLAKRNDIYSYDVELRKYITETDYELYTNYPKEGYKSMIKKSEVDNDNEGTI